MPGVGISSHAHHLASCWLLPSRWPSWRLAYLLLLPLIVKRVPVLSSRQCTALQLPVLLLLLLLLLLS
jgi:hypothetical protein